MTLNIKLASRLFSAFLVFAGLSASALPNVNTGKAANPKRNVLRTAVANCNEGQSTIDLDINNVRAKLMTGGDMWWDRGTTEARYEVPKDSRKNSLFAGSVWIGGRDENGNLKVTAQTYRQDGNDYWPGPLNTLNDVASPSQCSDWDYFWKLNKSDVLKFRQLYLDPNAVAGSQYDAIRTWPAKGNVNAVGQNNASLISFMNSTGRDYAPFIDVDNDGLYNSDAGDYPDIFGDQYIWWVFNDVGNVKGQTQTGTIQMEVQASAFAFATKDFMNDATFYNYRMINRGTLNLDSTFIATWTDADLGFATDDYVGSDTLRGLGIMYNGRAFDGSGQPNSYGADVPMVGVDFFIGPKKRYKDPLTGLIREDTLKMTVFNYFNNTQGDPNGNPGIGVEFYYIMTGSNRSGDHLKYDYQGPGITTTGHGPGPLLNSLWSGDPKDRGGWSECNCGNPPGDRRFVHSSGPFQLQSGAVYNDVTIGVVWVPSVGGCPNTSFSQIKAADDIAQDLFDTKFKLVEGPEAPTLTIRELDRRLLFYITNDSLSSNYQEKFGRDLSQAKYRVKTGKSKNFPDSLYKFEGYRVFQLKNNLVSLGDIYKDNGEVNQDVAFEVFQSDIKNDVDRIVNYVNRREIGDSVWEPKVRVQGNNLGISHSFELTEDKFASGTDKRFINYKNYYFVAISYSYNNFRPFQLSNVDSSQSIPYLESTKGSGGIPIPVVLGMPNPQNGMVDNALSSMYGEGVTIIRKEGIGNGGNGLQMDSVSEATALVNGTIPYPTYLANRAPVEVKVIDPVRVPAASDWEIAITGTVSGIDSTVGIDSVGGWVLRSNSLNVVYQNEFVIGTRNEQIIAKYGLSVSVQQVKRPGDDQTLGSNNGVISSDVTFSEPTYPWLAGVRDADGNSKFNWIRSGNFTEVLPGNCNYDDIGASPLGSTSVDSIQKYESLISNRASMQGSWAPYALAAVDSKPECGFGVAQSAGSRLRSGFETLPSIDVVFTADKTKWTRCAVVELSDLPSNTERRKGNGVPKFRPRSHASWTGTVDGAGQPVYATAPDDTGMSWFPGYAIDQGTGDRLNIVFGEDSYLLYENGRDMIWNPTASVLGFDSSTLFGGKHYIYVLGSKYDQDSTFFKDASNTASIVAFLRAYQQARWVGLPLLAPGYQLNSLADGLIPNTTRLRFRVTKPYQKYVPIPGQTLVNGGFPLYNFSTAGLAPTPYSDLAGNKGIFTDTLLNRIRVVPNPYYGYNTYEQTRLDTRVKIVNLPKTATISIYALDGTLVRRLKKDNPNQSFLEWDIRNAKGLPIASGMYLFHVSAEGYGEKVISWFGAMRPLDITQY